MTGLIRITLPAVVLALLPAWTSAEQLGRLFTTPEQRLRIDTLRYAQIEPEPMQAQTPEPAQEPEALTERYDQQVNFRGFVSRQRGDSTAWLNDASTLEGDLSLGNLEIKSIDKETGRIRILVPGRDGEVPLKVGETYDPNAESAK